MRHVVLVTGCVSLLLRLGVARAEEAPPTSVPRAAFAPSAPEGPATTEPRAAPTTTAPVAPAGAAPPPSAPAPAAAPTAAPYPAPAYVAAPPRAGGFDAAPASYASPPEANEGDDTDEPHAKWRPSDPGFVLAVERVAGFYGMSTSSSSGSSGDSATFLNLAGNPGAAGFLDPFSAPQLTAHGVLRGGVTFGGGIGYQSASLSSKTGETLDASSFTVSPRIGFITTVSGSLAIWIRGGITYASLTLEETPASSSCIGSGTGCGTSSPIVKPTVSWVDLSLDPMLVFFPVPHVGLLLGPAVDIGLSSSDSQSSSDPGRLTSYGASGGIAVFL